MNFTRITVDACQPGGAPCIRGLSRCRRLSDDEAQRLFNAVSGQLKLLMVAAIQTGMRRGEMLKLSWADVDAQPGWIRLRAETTRTGKPRAIPIHPTVQAVFDFLRLNADGEKKPATCRVCSNGVGEPMGKFDTAWRTARRKAGVENRRWHDMRHEFASRLLEMGANIIQVRDLLGHTDVKVTQKYLNLNDDQLKNAAERLKDPIAANGADLAEPEPQPEPEVSRSCHTPTDTDSSAVSASARIEPVS